MLTLNPQPESLPDMSALNPSHIDTALKHAEGWPITVGFFFMVVIMAAALYWLLFRFYPSWQTAQATRAANLAAEAAATRQHMTDVLNARGAEATKDVQSITTAIGAKVDNIAKDIDGVEAMTRDLSGKFAEVHNKVSGIHDILVRAMASKVGVVGVMLIFSGIIGYTHHIAVDSKIESSSKQLTPVANWRECWVDTDCRVPAVCKSGTCVRNTAKKTPAPTQKQSNVPPLHGGMVSRDYPEGGQNIVGLLDWRNAGIEQRSEYCAGRL